jgi:hypothetical protein
MRNFFYKPTVSNELKETTEELLLAQIRNGEELSNLNAFKKVGVNINNSNNVNSSFNPLNCAVQSENLKAIKMLIKSGAKLDTDIGVRVAHSKNPDLIDYFYNKFPRRFIKDPTDSRKIIYICDLSLNQAIKYQNIAQIKEILKHMKLKPDMIKTALDYYKPTVLEYLLRNSPSTLSRPCCHIHYAKYSNYVLTPLGYSAVINNQQAFRQILEMGGESLLSTKFKTHPDHITTVYKLIKGEDTYFCLNHTSINGIFQQIANKYLKEQSIKTIEKLSRPSKIRKSCDLTTQI